MYLDFFRPVDTTNIKTFRFGLIVVASMYAFWAVVVDFVSPQSYEEGRWMPALFCVTLAAISYKIGSNSFFIKYFHLFGLIALCSAVLHYLYLITKNDFSSFFTVGYFVVIAFSILVMSHVYQVVTMSLLSLIGSVYITSNVTWISKSEYGSLILTTTILALIVGILKIRLVSQKNKAIREEIKAKEKLVSTSKMTLLGEVSSGLGHEINNPLMIISSQLEMLSLLKKNPEVEEYLSSIEEQVFRIGKVTHVLKEFVSENKSIGSYFSIDHVVRLSLKSLETDSSTKLTYLPHENPCVYANEKDIHQIIVELLKNALEPRNVNNEVTIKVVNSADNVTILVSDTGPGISLDIQEKIFNPFFTTKDPNKGYGMGLTISKNLSLKNNCELNYQTSNEGSSFSLKIPKIAI